MAYPQLQLVMRAVHEAHGMLEVAEQLIELRETLSLGPTADVIDKAIQRAVRTARLRLQIEP